MSAAAFTVTVETRGEIPEDARHLARTSIEQLEQDADLLIRRARIKLTRLPDQTLQHPAVVQGNLDIGGIPLRAQAAARNVHEAIYLLRERLRDQLMRLLRAGSPYSGKAISAPRESLHQLSHDQHADADLELPPVLRHRIMRRKSVVLRCETVDEAAFRMDAMDYDCHLFTDADTGQDSMVFRSGPTGYSLAQLSAKSGPPRRRHLPVTVRPRPAPFLTPNEALARLNLTALPFLFFANTAAHPEARGAMLYERYDGHYGLLIPES
ncbi:sigma 54 modulation/S30EA-like ribosomal protein [Streptomyces sp. 846.5]|nr:sigma 54 modulation/S30EA ribosomal C-terminal domain-containing protein [Streptomyces sp. 846.5]TDT98111.1 sigma 54 modulation/S30EA-like ribosomal protein [Streptomyces sp. 846.5]